MNIFFGDVISDCFEEDYDLPEFEFATAVHVNLVKKLVQVLLDGGVPAGAQQFLLGRHDCRVLLSARQRLQANILHRNCIVVLTSHEERLTQQTGTAAIPPLCQFLPIRG